MNLSGLFFVIASNIARKKKGNISQSRICRAIAMVLPALLFSNITQFFLLWELYRHTNQTSAFNSTAAADVSSSSAQSFLAVQLVCIAMFFLDVATQYMELCNSSMVAFTREYCVDSEQQQNNIYKVEIAWYRRLFMYILIAVPEIVVWLGLLLVGTYFLLHSNDTLTLIFDTLALRWLLDVDNLVFTYLVPPKLRGVIALHKIEKRTILSETCTNRYFMHFHLVLSLIAAFLVVFYLSPYTKHLTKTDDSYMAVASIFSGFACFGVLYGGCTSICPSRKRRQIRPHNIS